MGIPPRVERETREFLSLLQAGDYERLMDNYCHADSEDFPRIEAALQWLVEGEGAEAFRRWSRLVIRQGPQVAVEHLRRAGDPHPGYTVGLLQFLARTPDASGFHVSAERRARRVLQWHIAGLYDGLRVGEARMLSAAEREGEDIVVRLACPGESVAERPGDDPRRLRWRRLPVGLVLKFALADRLETVRRVLAKPVPLPER